MEAADLGIPIDQIAQQNNMSAADAFKQINDGLQDDKTRKQAIKKANAIFSFDLKNSGKYYIDLKSSGTAAKGVAPEGKKADITLTMDEPTFLSLVSGKGNAQYVFCQNIGLLTIRKLYMQGKIKIKGNMMKATALGDVLKAIQAPKSKL